jgi:catechol 2,3-dioxygenase-like lactoylglutathione lyase family enzyme
MTLLGVQSIVYGVDDLDACTRFYEDFGLELAQRDEGMARFQLAEGSSVTLKRRDDTGLPLPFLGGDVVGPREIVWGVDSQSSLEVLASDLQRDRAVHVDANGTVHCSDDSGICIGFRVFARQPLGVIAAQEENNLAQVARWNRHRKWYERASPKQINHVVFGVPNVDAAVAFYTRRLGFRVTDIMRGFGMFMRCDGRNDHHNLFLFRAPKLLFSHVSFAVETIDELMIGANDMQRRGWKSDVGLGRHRISSLVFYYVGNPAGGQSEYSADSDYLTDDWQPRLWDASFGHYQWLGLLPPDARMSRQNTTEVVEGPIPKLEETVRAADTNGPAGAGERR